MRPCSPSAAPKSADEQVPGRTGRSRPGRRRIAPPADRTAAAAARPAGRIPALRRQDVADAPGELLLGQLPGLVGVELVEPRRRRGRRTRPSILSGRSPCRPPRRWPARTSCRARTPASAGPARPAWPAECHGARGRRRSFRLEELSRRLPLGLVEQAVVVLVELLGELEVLPRSAGAAKKNVPAAASTLGSPPGARVLRERAARLNLPPGTIRPSTRSGTFSRSSPR